MAFTKPDVITDKRVIAMLFRQGFFCAERLQDIVQLFHIRPAFSQTFQVLAKLRSSYEFKHRRLPQTTGVAVLRREFVDDERARRCVKMGGGIYQ